MGSEVAFLTILGMAAVTYAERASGLLVVSRLTLSPRLRAWLDGVPGAVLVSLVAPVVLTHGPAEAAAGAVTLVVAARTRNLLAAMAVGVVTVWAIRSIGG